MRKKVFVLALISLALTACAAVPLGPAGPAKRLYTQIAKGASLDQMKATVDSPEFQTAIKTDTWGAWRPPQCFLADSDKNNEILAYMVKAGLNVSTCPGTTEIPVIVAVEHGAVKNAELIANAGADLHQRNGDNENVLNAFLNSDDPEINQYFVAFKKMQYAWIDTKKANTEAAYRKYLAAYPEARHSDEARKTIAKLVRIKKEKAAQEAKLAALEAQLPVGVRYDKYMVRLSALLKTQQYEKALPVFAQIEKLNTKRDPSFDYFYGESLLKTGRYEEAVARLYKYIKKQGTGAKHYAESLDLINQAEAKL